MTVGESEKERGCEEVKRSVWTKDRKLQRETEGAVMMFVVYVDIS